MIRIVHTADVQKFVITCTELVSITNPKFLFVFTHKVTNEVYKIILPDLSTKPNRYNLFELQGTFFTNDGWYNYKVYEQSSDTNTDETLSGAIVEEGRLFVDGLNDLTYTENNTTKNYKEYGG